MGLIFRDLNDDQQEAMMKSFHVGQTWQFRYLKIKMVTITVISVIATLCITALIDYSIFKFTGHSGLFGWLFG